jgi:hypothetical protein
LGGLLQENQILNDPGSINVGQPEFSRFLCRAST